MKTKLIKGIVFAFCTVFCNCILGCETIDWKVKSASPIVDPSSKAIKKEFVLSFCKNSYTAIPSNMKGAIDFLAAALPKEYLYKLKVNYPKTGIDDIPLTDALAFVDLYRMLEDRWGFSPNYQDRKGLTNLQREAYDRGLYFNNALFFEWLMHGVWQKITGLPISLAKQELNGIFLKEDIKKNVMPRFDSFCTNSLNKTDRPLSYRFNSGFTRRVFWNYCDDDKQFYMYLFEIGWLPMTKNQVCFLSKVERLAGRTPLNCD